MSLHKFREPEPFEIRRAREFLLEIRTAYRGYAEGDRLLREERERIGSQIVVTSHCRTTADKWASLLSKVSKVRGVIESSEDAVKNKGTCLLPTQVRVWRTYATV